MSSQVDSSSNFEWQRQLRYYWDLDQDNCVANMALSTYVYGYEYLGACPRLVITPLTVTQYTNTQIHTHTQTHIDIHTLCTNSYMDYIYMIMAVAAQYNMYCDLVYSLIFFHPSIYAFFPPVLYLYLRTGATCV